MKTSHDIPPAYAVVFVGGFGDILTGILYRVFDRFKGLVEGVPYAKAYYHWDGGGWGLMGDQFQRIMPDLLGFHRKFPGTPLVFVGHSYGGATSMELARLFYRETGRDDFLVLVTIDAVSRRQPRTRAAGLAFWANSYISEGGGFWDWVPRVGGRWGETPDADVNLAFSGYDADEQGIPFCHRRPVPLYRESPPDEAAESLEDIIRRLLGDRLAG